MYAMIGEEYVKLSKSSKRKTEVKKLLIYYGGGDNSLLVEKTILALVEIKTRSIECDIVIGENTIIKKEIKEIIKQSENIRVHSRVHSLADLMYCADLAIGACGTTSIERLCLGLGSIVVTTAENQLNLAKALESEKLIYLIGKSEMATMAVIKRKLNEVIATADEEELNMPKISDGYGVNRIVNAMSGISRDCNLREVQKTDQEILLFWSNEYTTRKNSFNRERIPRKIHRRWFLDMIDNKNTNMYIMEDKDGCPLAQIRFDRDKNEGYKISISVDYAARGYGIGSQLLKRGLRYHQEKETGPYKYYAEVIKTNRKSLNLFHSQGFRKVAESGESVILYRDTKD